MTLPMFAQDHAPERSFCRTRYHSKSGSDCASRTTNNYQSIIESKTYCWSWCWSKGGRR